MKKFILSAFLIGIYFSAMSGSPSFESKMKEAINAMDNSKTADDFKKAANTFDRIAKAETDEWLPLYYSANIKIILIYIDSAANQEQKDMYLDQADVLLSKMEELTDKKESEVFVLKSFSIVSRIGIDPISRGQSMYGGYQAALAKAGELDPENPRVKYMLLSSEVGQAQWFGQDVTSFCPRMKELHDSWDSYQPVSAIHPTWGKEQVLQMMQACN